MWAQNATTSTPQPAYARSTATVNMSNHIWFSTFSWCRLLQPPGTAVTGWMLKRVDRNKNLNHTYTCMLCECKMLSKFDASTCICTFNCHCEHAKSFWFSTFSWCRLIQPPGTAVTGWMLKRVDRNKNLNHTYSLHAMWTQSATTSTPQPAYARSTAAVNKLNRFGFQHLPRIFRKSVTNETHFFDLVDVSGHRRRKIRCIDC